MTTLQFLGAAGTVTGSKFLLDSSGSRVLVDCGLFQGLPELRQRNWEPLPVPPASIDAVVLTHTHLDHTGYLPRLLRDGFGGPVFATKPTADLMAILLADAGKLQEEEASYRNEKGVTRHRPALPLFTEAEGRAAAEAVRIVDMDARFTPLPGWSATYRTAGHVLGAAHLELAAPGGGLRLLFSGDVGRYDAPILDDPTPIGAAPDALVVESTYGDRLHSPEPIEDQLQRAVLEAVERGGAIVVPAFAVGRTQDLLYHLGELEHAGRIPELPVYIDSPMGIRATDVYRRHAGEFDEAMRAIVAAGRSPLRRGGRVRFTQGRQESMALNTLPGPFIVVAGAGMLTGGRVLHHLIHRLPDPRSTILFVGFQAEGTRGRQLLDGATSLRVFNREVPVRARVERIDGLSAHADAGELLRWLRTAEGAPRRTFVVHGEPGPAAALAERIREELGWKVSVPPHLESYELDGR
ncbi:MAG TPA: MBL fold metallo-hydrolase [Thermoanaerobaculia bacterium]|nr:MBL fold metallo-hydrolase [Thermoanaerobaculia bacterium]